MVVLLQMQSGLLSFPFLHVTLRHYYLSCILRNSSVICVFFYIAPLLKMNACQSAVFQNVIKIVCKEKEIQCIHLDFVV